MSTTVSPTDATTVLWGTARSPARLALRRLFTRPVAVISLCGVAFLVLVAVFAPWIAPHDPIETNWSAVLKAPDWAHWMGTDENGRDVLSRMVFATRTAMITGACSVGIAASIGVPLGLGGGLGGGWADVVIGRFVDMMLVIPGLILAIILAALLGPSLHNAIIAIGISGVPVYVRLSRSAAMDAATNDYVEAARALGNPPWRVAVRHILPNVVPPVLVQATLAIAGAILAESALSFLGLGQQPPAPSWGGMLDSAQRFLTQAPWLAVFPGVAIFLVVLSFNLVGDALRDTLDPRAN